MIKYHIWHEDKQTTSDGVKASTTQFWETLLQESNIANNVEVRGFNGNAKLYDFILQFKFDNAAYKNHKFYIFMDCVLDNPDALNYYISIVNYIENLNVSNVYVADLLSFEYLLLSFELFDKWIVPTKEQKNTQMYLDVRNAMLDCIENQKQWVNYPAIVKFVLIINNYNNKSNVEKIALLAHTTSEQIVTKLLGCLTNSLKSDFIVTKTKLGECWFCSCDKERCVKLDCKLALCVPRKEHIVKVRNIWNKSKASTYLHKLDNSINIKS